jgi:hypothetical protein
MSGQYSFDDFQDELMGYEPIDPFYAIKYNDDAVVLDWVNKDLKNKLHAAQGRFRTYRYNLAMYKGIQFKHQDTRNPDREDTTETLRKPKVVVNFVQEMTDAKLAKFVLTRPSLDLIPNNNEWSDKLNAKTIKLLVENRYDEVDIEDYYADAWKRGFIYGMSYTFAGWDKDAGPLHPEYQKARELGVDIPLYDKNGKKIGNKTIDQDVHIGDVVYNVYGPDRCFPQLGKRRWCDVDDITVIDFVHVEELRAQYPRKKNLIEPTDMIYWDNETLEERRLKDYNNCIRITYYHRPCGLFPEGRKIVCTDLVVLENKSFPYTKIGNRLPCEPFTDIDIPDEIYGRSFIQNISMLQRHFNAIASGVARNHGIGSAPKWMVPKGSCSISSLNNDFTVVEFSGPTAPQLVTYNPTPSEIFMYQEKLERWIQKQSVVYGVSRGEPPKGVDAQIAMQYLDEQEQQREGRNIAKKYRYLRNLFKLTMGIMGQYYLESDGRTIRILGKDNGYLIKHFKGADFASGYDVRVQNTSALPDTKTGKISSIVNLNKATQADPVYRRAEIIRALDLGLDEEFKDAATVSVKAAESTVQSIVDGEKYVEPQIYDDFINQYPIYVRTLWSRSFKEELPSDAQQKLIQHISTMEGLMWERSLKNQKFLMELQEFDYYPIFFEPLQESDMMVPKIPQLNTSVLKQSVNNAPMESMAGMEGVPPQSQDQTLVQQQGE